MTADGSRKPGSRHAPIARLPGAGRTTPANDASHRFFSDGPRHALSGVRLRPPRIVRRLQAYRDGPAGAGAMIVRDCPPPEAARPMIGHR